MIGELNFAYVIIIFSITFSIVAILLILTLNHMYKQNMAKERGIRFAIYNTQEEERRRISIELHDNIGTRLSALKLFTESLIRNGDNNKIIDEIVSTTKGTITELRSVITDTSGDHILRNGLELELQNWVDKLSNSKIDIKVIIDTSFPEFKNQFGVNLYRIIQELVNNSIKHSGCNEIHIQLKSTDAFIYLTYFDNGNGFSSDSSKKEGMGLKNIQARILMFNGDWHRELSLYNIKFPLIPELLLNGEKN